MKTCRFALLIPFALLAGLTGCQALNPSFRFAPQAALTSPQFSVESADSPDLNAFEISGTHSKPLIILTNSRSIELRRRLRSYTLPRRRNQRYTTQPISPAQVYRHMPLQAARAGSPLSDKSTISEDSRETGLILIVCGLLVGVTGAAFRSGGSLSASLLGLNILLAGGVLLFIGLLVYFLASRS